MNRFPVWLRPLGNCCKVKVEGHQNVKWLQAILTSQGVECTEAVPVAGTDRYVFRAIYTAQLTPSELQRFLSSQREVQLMLEPAWLHVEHRRHPHAVLIHSVRETRRMRKCQLKRCLSRNPLAA